MDSILIIGGLERSNKAIRGSRDEFIEQHQFTILTNIKIGRYKITYDIQRTEPVEHRFGISAACLLPSELEVVRRLLTAGDDGKVVS